MARTVLRGTLITNLSELFDSSFFNYFTVAGFFEYSFSCLFQCIHLIIASVVLEKAKRCEKKFFTVAKDRGKKRIYSLILSFFTYFDLCDDSDSVSFLAYTIYLGLSF
jgi:hypothetical protein